MYTSKLGRTLAVGVMALLGSASLTTGPGFQVYDGASYTRTPSTMDEGVRSMIASELSDEEQRRRRRQEVNSLRRMFSAHRAWDGKNRRSGERAHKRWRTAKRAGLGGSRS